MSRDIVINGYAAFYKFLLKRLTRVKGLAIKQLSFWRNPTILDLLKALRHENRRINKDILFIENNGKIATDL